MDYAAANALVQKHKGALTRAKKSRDPHKVVKVCEAAFVAFETLPHGWPDNWHLWNVARIEAETAITYNLPYRGA
jgi:hypothetical protein